MCCEQCSKTKKKKNVENPKSPFGMLIVAFGPRNNEKGDNDNGHTSSILKSSTTIYRYVGMVGLTKTRNKFMQYFKCVVFTYMSP